MHSQLVSYVNLSPNKTAPRTEKIDRITVHHAAAKTSLKALGNLFADPKRQASANYGIDSEGRIACFVEEEDRAWTSGSRENDMHAITIEVANCGGAPDWPISDKAYAALLALCEDICRRHDFRLNFTGGPNGSLTMHKYFQPTACPGPYLEAKFPQIAREVNRRLEGEKNVLYRVQLGAFREKENARRLLEKLHAQGYPDAFIQTAET